GLAGRVPAAKADRDEANAGLDQSSCRQGALAEAGVAVTVPHRGRLLGQVERFLGFVGTEDLEGLLVEGVEPVHQVARLVGGLEALVEALEQLVAIVQLVELEIVGQLNAARLQRAAATLAAGGAFND